MNQPRRFKADPTLRREGQLMALGTLEVPNPEAKRLVAQRLGISAAALASAAAATVVAPTAAAAATTAATATTASVGTLGAAVAKGTGSFIAVTLVKAAVVGVSLGIVSYAGVRFVRSTNSASEQPSATVASTGKKLAQRARNEGAATAASASALEDRIEGAASVRANRTSSSSLTSGVSTIAPALSSDSRSPAAAPVARFDDIETPAPLVSAGVNSTESPTSKGALGDIHSANLAGTLHTDPRLAREVRSLDLARARASHGDSAGALQELQGFESQYGYAALRKEAMLVQIDVMLSLGHTVEAAAIARRLLLAGAPATRRASLEALVRAHP